MQTLPSINRKNNFHLMRFIFASIVVFVHIHDLTGNNSLHIIKASLSSKLAVEGFFIISGFLIFMSCEQCGSIKKYFKKRFSRIYPAYFTVIFASAVFGGFITTLPIKQYLSLDFFKYLLYNLSFLNFKQPALPGVFTSNPVMPAVNGSLWTIKIEVAFYIAVPILVWIFRRYRKQQNIIMIGIFILSSLYFVILNKLYLSTGSSFALLLSKQIPGQMRFFITGAFLYYNHESFLEKKNFYLPGGILLFFLSKISILGFMRPVALGLIVIWLVFSLPMFNSFGNYGDYSYGIYLFHFPIIQYLISKGFYRLNPSLDIILTLILVGITAFISWNFVEKKFISIQNNKNCKVLPL